jgi:hypothetical protein
MSHLIKFIRCTNCFPALAFSWKVLSGGSAIRLLLIITNAPNFPISKLQAQGLALFNFVFGLWFVELDDVLLRLQILIFFQVQNLLTEQLFRSGQNHRGRCEEDFALVFFLLSYRWDVRSWERRKLTSCIIRMSNETKKLSTRFFIFCRPLLPKTFNGTSTRNCWLSWYAKFNTF